MTNLCTQLCGAGSVTESGKRTSGNSSVTFALSSPSLTLAGPQKKTSMSKKFFLGETSLTLSGECFGEKLDSLEDL